MTTRNSHVFLLLFSCGLAVQSGDCGRPLFPSIVVCIMGKSSLSHLALYYVGRGGGAGQVSRNNETMTSLLDLWSRRHVYSN